MDARGERACLKYVGCAERSEAHLSRSMRFVLLTASYALGERVKERGGGERACLRCW